MAEVETKHPWYPPGWKDMRAWVRDNALGGGAEGTVVWTVGIPTESTGPGDSKVLLHTTYMDEAGLGRRAIVGWWWVSLRPTGNPRQRKSVAIVLPEGAAGQLGTKKSLGRGQVRENIRGAPNAH